MDHNTKITLSTTWKFKDRTIKNDKSIKNFFLEIKSYDLLIQAFIHNYNVVVKCATSMHIKYIEHFHNNDNNYIATTIFTLVLIRNHSVNKYD